MISDCELELWRTNYDRFLSKNTQDVTDNYDRCTSCTGNGHFPLHTNQLNQIIIK